MNTELKKIPKDLEKVMIDSIIGDIIDPFINAGFWYSLFRTD